jgi:hypothetical protein
MSDDDRRQADATTSDLSRPVATGDDSDYSLSVDEALARYQAAGLPRTPRSIQRYCTKGYLEARRVETEFGEKFLIKPESVDRHIAYIMEVRPVATGRDLARQVATNEATEIAPESTNGEAGASDDKVRQVPTTPEMSQPVVAFDARYVAVLERENEFLREQIAVKDEQIKGMGQHLEQSNILTAGLHKLLTPLLGRSGAASSEERVHTYTPNAGAGDNTPAT